MASAGQNKSGIPRLEAVARFVLVLVLLLVTHWRRPYAGPCGSALESRRASRLARFSTASADTDGRTDFLYFLPSPSPHQPRSLNRQEGYAFGLSPWIGK